MIAEQIKVLSDFSMSPGPRYCKQGPDSGEEFYHKVLNRRFAEAYKNSVQLVLDLDGTDGYMSSFLDEAIGNLVYDFGEDAVKTYLRVVSKEEDVWTKLINNEVIPEWAKHRVNNEEPLKTSKKDHNAWYRLINGELLEDVWVHSA